ncbi:KIF-binding protein-like [Anneissia japonica]|uniref:KIF-binding protein-like n=1 Tax=Anneissia japonica TaxID=1529436 RepID=UPI00142557AE|nr:KIF-binding protein-like [Anneissia japonica]
MSAFTHYLKTTGCKQYKEARHLAEELSQHDAETEPFKSKYKAREILVDLKKNLNKYSEEVDSEGCEGRQCLEEAQELYNKYKHEVDRAPVYIHELLEKDCEEKDDHERWQEFEKLYTHTLYYLAQVYGGLKENHKSASYCQTTLQRQLQYDQYEPLEWALNCATLSQYYITESRYTQARHCLASASFIFSLHKDKGERKADEGEEERRLEDIANREADLARCWTKYCISLLEDSIVYSKEKLSADTSGHDKEEDKDTDENDKHQPRFESLELTSLEMQVTDKYVTVFEEARDVFLAAQRWIAESKKFYQIDGFVSEYIEIIKDHSMLFKLLAFFETDSERKCKMFKRRVDMLQSVIKQLNPQHFLLLSRQLIFECAETYSGMVDLKICIAEQSQPTTQHAVKKINLLIMHSIGQYQAFIDSLRKPDGTMPNALEEDVVRPAMVAHFCMGRLYSKLISESRKKIENMNSSLNQYKAVVDYCKSHPGVVKLVEAELEICEEMVLLLPARIDQLRTNLD